MPLLIRPHFKNRIKLFSNTIFAARILKSAEVGENDMEREEVIDRER